MRYLELPELVMINAILSDVEIDDGSRIIGRIEAYSCKAAGQDKKLYKQLTRRFKDARGSIKGNNSGSLPLDFSPSRAAEPSDHRASTSRPIGKMVAGSSTKPSLSSPPDRISLNSSSPSTMLGEEPNITSSMTLKLYYYLAATMNQMFPDYDFSEVSPNVFVEQPSLPAIVAHVNTTLFNAGLDKSVRALSNFSRTLWDSLDEVISLNTAHIYSFQPSATEEDVDDPFRGERGGTIWSFNYLFWSKERKRVLVFACRAVSALVSPRDSEVFGEDGNRTPLIISESQRSITPSLSN